MVETGLFAGSLKRHTGFITLAVLLQLADKVLVLALPALAVFEVMFLELGGETLEDLAFAGSNTGGCV
jgi:hypothetical protein